MKKFLALLLVLVMCVALVACNTGNEEETTGTGSINVPGEGTDTDGGEDGSEVETDTPKVEIGDPGEYSYSECNETVYVNNPGSAVTLRSEQYEAMGSVPHSTELKRIGLSTDAANYWSKVIYEEKEYYVATKFLTTMRNPDEGFVEVSKTVVVNDATGALIVRNLPSYEGQIIGHANAGVDINVVAENPTTGWYKILFINFDGEVVYGYIASDAKYFVSAE